MKRKFKHFGFSLAEMLVTISVVGVLAIMTLPTLKGNYEAHVTEARVKTNYNLILQAASYSKSSGDLYIKADPKTWYNLYLKNNLKISKECSSKPSECWHRVSTQTGGNLNLVTRNSMAFSLENGADVLITKVAKNAVRSTYGVDLLGDAQNGLIILFDINGDDVPNKLGSDIYIMVWNGKEIVPAGHSKTQSEVLSNCVTYKTCYFCLQYMMDNGWKVNRKIFE